ILSARLLHRHGYSVESRERTLRGYRHPDPWPRGTDRSVSQPRPIRRRPIEPQTLAHPRRLARIGADPRVRPSRWQPPSNAKNVFTTKTRRKREESEPRIARITRMGKGG